MDQTTTPPTIEASRKAIADPGRDQLLRELAALTLELNEKLAALPVLECVACTIEQYEGKREHISAACVVVAGTSSCREHLVFGVPQRTPDGVIDLGRLG